MKYFAVFFLIVLIHYPLSTLCAEDIPDTRLPFTVQKGAEANPVVEIFKAERKRSKALDHGWAACGLLDNTCMVIIWIRGTKQDTRIIYRSEKAGNVCTVYISAKDFEKYFSYCMLLGIHSNADNGFSASFGGGPAGNDEKYWFEWGDPSHVKAEFYCTLK